MHVSDELWEFIPEGWLERDEAELLLDVAKQTSGPILEVGCYKGRSTCLLASLGRPMFCVDPFCNFDSDDPSGNKIYEIWKENTRQLTGANILLFKMEIEKWYTRPAGFAYLDGDHSYKGTKSQILMALDSGVEQMCIHDYALAGGGRFVASAIHDSSQIQLVTVVGKMAHCRVVKEQKDVGNS